MSIADVFIFKLFARVNPVYSPRRKRQTALRWAKCAAHIAAYLRQHNTPESYQALRMWAALFTLDTASSVNIPKGYVPLGDGSLRGHARDRGGVENHCLSVLRDVVLAENNEQPSARDIACWNILFPQTALLAQDIYRERTEEDYSAALAEWEIIRGDEYPANVQDAISFSDDPQRMYVIEFSCREPVDHDKIDAYDCIDEQAAIDLAQHYADDEGIVTLVWSTAGYLVKECTPSHSLMPQL